MKRGLNDSPRSLKSLLIEAYSSESDFENREEWHRLVSRKALSEKDQPETKHILVRYLLEGDLTPWKQGYDLKIKDGIQTMLWVAAGGEDPEKTFDTLRKKNEESEPRCQSVWIGSHVAYRCVTCGISENSCMCVYCFDAKDHVDHEYRLYSSSAGGCCDCGDPIAWRESGFCKKHRVDKSAPYQRDERILSNARFACSVVTEHLMWALRRCFFYGKHRPEISGAYGVAKCFDFFKMMTSVCRETMIALGEALAEKRNICVELIGWGHYIPPFATDIVSDGNAINSLLRLGCYLPSPLSFDLGAILLKLLLEPAFKDTFTRSFIEYLENYLELIWKDDIKPTTYIQIAQAQVLNALGEQDIPEDSDEEDEPIPTVVVNLNQKPPHHVLPSSPKSISDEEVRNNARQFLDRIYCQLFHSESISLMYSDRLLDVMLFKLANHFNQAVLDGKFHLTRLKPNFYRRILLQLNLLLQHDSLGMKVIYSPEYFSALLDVLRSLQLLDSQRRRESNEDHISHPNRSFKLAFPLMYEFEEQLVSPLLNSIQKNIDKEEAYNMIKQRLLDCKTCIQIWYAESAPGFSEFPNVYSCHVPLSRFFFRFYFIFLNQLKDDCSQKEYFLFDFEDIFPLIIPSLRVLAMIFQILDGKWIRNGQLMLTTSHLYLKIFPFTTLEPDLLPLKICLAFPNCDVNQVFSRCELILGIERTFKVFGAICFGNESLSATRRSAIHCLAHRDFSFSDLESHCPPKSSRELEDVLKDIAEIHEVSAMNPASATTNSSAYYSLKSAQWKFVEFGFYLRWYRFDEENALTRFKRSKNIKDTESFFPILDLESIGASKLSAKIFQEATELVARCLDLWKNEETNEYLSLLSCLLLIGGFRVGFLSHSTEHFNKVEFSEALKSNVKEKIPKNVYEELSKHLLVDQPYEIAQENDGMRQTSISKIASKAQEKALKKFAKKQKKFRTLEQEEEEEELTKSGNLKITDDASLIRSVMDVESTNEIEIKDEPLCSLCKKPETDEEHLNLLICKAGSSLLYTLESVALEGEGKCIAKENPENSEMTKSLPRFESISNQDLPYMDSRSVFVCVNTLRERFLYGPDSIDFDYLANSSESYRTVLHTCTHLTHASCLESYRSVLIHRAEAGQPYEGQGIIMLKNGELFCPVCRRITSDLLPLLKPVKFPQLQSKSIFEKVGKDWLKSRLEEYNNHENSVKLLQQDPSAEVVVKFLKNHPFGKRKDHIDFGNLILTEVYTCDSSPGRQKTVQAVISPLLQLAVRQPHCYTAKIEDQPNNPFAYYSRWNQFVFERFGEDRGRVKRRATAINADLTLVFIEWLIYCPYLRFASVQELSCEGKKLLNFLLPFARIQDLLLEEIFKMENESLNYRIDQESSKEGDAIRAAGLFLALNDYLNQPTPPYRLSPKQRSDLEVKIDLFLDSIKQNEFTASSILMKNLIQNYIPNDSLPFKPKFNFPRESAVERLIKHACIVLGIESDELLQGTSVEFEETRKYLKRAMFSFFKEVSELIASPDRPLGVAVTSMRLLCSALLPSVYAKLSSRNISIIELPTEYSSLTISYIARNAICKNCHKPPEIPALCLLCGTLICYHGACCRVDEMDEFLNHGLKCPRGTGTTFGLYMLLRNCVVIVIFDKFRHCLWGSLYLDAHNEEDHNFQRGKPLYLNLDRLDALEKLQKSQSWFLETKILGYITFN